MATLEEQLRAQHSGDWNIQGIDRAAELAGLLRANGITDLSQLKITPRQATRQESGYDESGQGSTSIPVTTYDLEYGGKKLGYLGDVNQGGDYGKVGVEDINLNRPDLIGWSSAGHGNVGYRAVTGQDGRVSIQPVWNSSSDAQDARTAAQIYGTVLGAGYGSGAAGGAATGAAPSTLGLSSAEVAAMGTPAMSTSLGSMPTVAGSATGGLGLTASELAAMQTAPASSSLGSTPATAGAKSMDGWDVLSNIGTKAVGTALAGAAAGAVANSLAPSVDTSRYDKLFDNMLTDMQLARDRGTDQWNDYISTWRPVEQKLSTSVLNYDTPQRRESAAREASGLVSSQFDQQRQDAEREMVRAGLDPSTIQALGASSRIEQAKAEAGAENTARNTIEMQGLSLLDSASRFGRNAPATSAQQSSLATSQGNTASNVASNEATIGLNTTQQRNAIIGDLLGAGLKAAGMGLFNGIGG